MADDDHACADCGAIACEVSFHACLAAEAEPAMVDS